MYLNLNFSEIDTIRKKLKALVFVKKIEKQKKYLSRIRRLLDTNKLIFNDIVDLDLMKEIDEGINLLGDIKLLNSNININKLNELIRDIAIVKYIKIIIPEKNYKYISLNKLKDHIYVYNLLQKYGDKKIMNTNIVEGPGLSRFSYKYNHIDNILYLIKSKDLLVSLNSIRNLLLNMDTEKLYIELSKLYDKISTINELIKDLDEMGEYDDLISYILKEDIPYSNFLNDLLSVSNLTIVAKYISLDEFNKLNLNDYDVNIFQQPCILEPSYDLCEVEKILRDIMKTLNYDYNSLYIYEFEEEDYKEMLGLKDEEEIEEFKDNNYGLSGLKLKLPLNTLNENQKEQFDDYTSRLLTADIYDYNYYDYSINIEENFIELIVSDGDFFNSDFLENILNILILCKKESLCIAS